MTISRDAGAAVKTRPILFSGPMVRAILEGRKWMTRRVVKPELPGAPLFVGRYRPTREDGGEIKEGKEVFGCYGEDWGRVCPYGGPGDLLWVRETWGDSWHHAQPRYFYRASDPELDRHPDFDGWNDAIHMPRRASRILLRIKAVRVERLDAITEEDAKAEGVPPAVRPPGLEQWEEKGWEWCPYTTEFRGLWEDLHGPGSWEVNPWVWVVEFERVLPAA